MLLLYHYNDIIFKILYQYVDIVRRLRQRLLSDLRQSFMQKGAAISKKDLYIILSWNTDRKWQKSIQK